jgi:hypothetical protein
MFCSRFEQKGVSSPAILLEVVFKDGGSFLFLLCCPLKGESSPSIPLGVVSKDGGSFRFLLCCPLKECCPLKD